MRRGKLGHRDAQGKWPCEDGGREWSYAACSYWKLDEGKKPPSLQASEGAWSCQHVGFRLLASKTVRGFLLLQAAQVMACSSGSPRKPVQHPATWFRSLPFTPQGSPFKLDVRQPQTGSHLYRVHIWPGKHSCILFPQDSGRAVTLQAASLNLAAAHLFSQVHELYVCQVWLRNQCWRPSSCRGHTSFSLDILFKAPFSGWTLETPEFTHEATRRN